MTNEMTEAVSTVSKGRPRPPLLLSARNAQLTRWFMGCIKLDHGAFGLHGVECCHHRHGYNRIRGATKPRFPFDVSALRRGPRHNNAELRRAELIIVPGRGIASTDELGAKLAGPACRRASAMLVEAFQSGVTVAASCANTFLQAKAGLLLDGRRATHDMVACAGVSAPVSRSRSATDQMVVADWPTAAGGAAMAQMTQLAGPKLAKACQTNLCWTRRAAFAGALYGGDLSRWPGS